MSTLNRLSNWYFRPIALETWREGRLYRLLGVRLYKYYLPTSGDLISRLRGVRRLNLTADGILGALAKHEAATRSYEVRHIVGGVTMHLLSWWAITVHQRGDWIVLIIANSLINGYPILVQRYNRIRLLNAMRRARRRPRGLIDSYSANPGPLRPRESDA